MPKPFALLFMALILARCSTVTVGKCDSSVKDFLSKSPHRSIVIHPRGCYMSWGQPPSPFEAMSWDEPPSAFEAERRALLLCSETNPDSDKGCTVVATDNSICPLTLRSWIRERRGTNEVAEKMLRERHCEFGSTFEVKSAPGTKPPSVGAEAKAVIARALTAFGLRDYDTDSDVEIVFGRSSESKSNWTVTEALHFVKQKDGNKTCVLQVSTGWDPNLKYFETLLRVHVIGCFDTGEGSG